MAGIIPISSTRVTDALVRERLLVQLQADQAALFRLQKALSTGRRIDLPSEDPPAAQRGISLQSLLERKQQVGINVTNTQSYLTASDVALSSVSGLLSDVRGAALSVTDNVSSSEAKRAVAQQVDHALRQVIDAANQQFRGRYLFAGSQGTTLPFAEIDGHVRYSGNEGQVQSYADLDLLLASNVNGNEVFGAFSSEVQGSVNLTPNLTADTLLANLHGGQGISTGSIAISDGLNTSIIDISSAVTVGDLQALIEANPPEGVPPTGRIVTVTITSTGLDVQLNGFSGAGLTIKEVGEGTTAAELGILAEAGVGVGPIVGADLDPRLTKTTRLADLPVALDLASGLQIVNAGQTHVLSFAGDITVEDLLNTLNGSDAGVLAEINSSGTGINVRSRLSGGDFAIGENGGTTATDLGLRSFTLATRLEGLNHGLGVHTRQGDDFEIQLKNGTRVGIDVSAAQTIGDVIGLINAAGGGLVTAALSQFGNGIELTTTDASTTAPFAVFKVLGSQAADDLGLVPVGQDQSAPATVGVGVETITGRDVTPWR
jgi:flagellar hook-associated protein 3 FlgL